VVGEQTGAVSGWSFFESQAPELAAFGRERLTAGPAYLGTVRRDGTPRVHPVAPIIGAGRLFLFMEPTSPKGRDLRERRWFALHSGVPDTFGTGGEFHLRGQATIIHDDGERRAEAVAASGYQPEERYILFELGVDEARGHGYGDVALPEPSRWAAPPR
jgi:hypothetical protein